jgi:hypothetical protein
MVRTGRKETIDTLISGRIEKMRDSYRGHGFGAPLPNYDDVNQCAFGSTTGSIVCVAPALRTWIVAMSSAYTFCQPSM